MENDNPISTIDDLNQLIDAGDDADAQADNSETDTASDDNVNQPADDNNDQHDDDEGVTDDEGNPLPTDKGKQAKAFAGLRVKTKQQKAVLSRILQRAGMDVSLADDPDALLDILENADVKAQAEQQHVPPEMLKRINELERYQQRAETERKYNDGVEGFKGVQSKFDLNEQELTEFAKQLKDDGLNPFQDTIDLEKEYVARNLNQIIKKRSDAAVQEALNKQSKAKAHSTTPAAAHGGAGTESEGNKVNSMAELEMLLKQSGF